MASTLRHNAYGKSSIRLTKVVRGPHRHELVELSIDIMLEGDFADSYLSGDNRKVIATDSMKNTVYVLAKENNFKSIEDFAALVCRHFKSTYSQVQTATVSISQTKWDRIELGDRPHPHAFIGGSTERRTCCARVETGTAGAALGGGITGLQLLKTTDSEFTGFVSDRYRTLKDTRDRIFATSVDANWAYGTGKPEFNSCFTAIRAALLATFATHHSLAVQQTLLAMGEAALTACPSIRSIDLKMPNQHRIPFDLEPLGIKNDNELFVPCDEPFGMITGVVTRE
ncbi:MAG: factor-independent urate hydroxylase [Tepidisphaeraceae bacterium]